MDILTNFILPIMVAVFASTGFWSWLSQRKASNKDLMDAIKDMSEKVDKIDYKVDQNEAISCRARLLRFNKELIKKEKHTQEEFDQCLEDCDKYERFCEAHPGFKNNKAVLSIENIERCYKLCQQDGDFL
jgi:hypothetical protein